jgi:hypothetical protein
MSQLGAADIAALIADLNTAGGAVDITLGQDTINGVRDSDAVEFFGAEAPAVRGDDLALHVETAAIPATWVPGETVVVDDDDDNFDDQPFVIRELVTYGDGAMTRLHLRNP